MQITQLLELIDRLAPTLLALDQALTDANPGASAADPLDADLDDACRALRRQVQAVIDAIARLGEPALAAGVTSEVAMRQSAAGVADAADGLTAAYRRAVRQSQLAGRPALHERLAEAARDNLVATAHALAEIIDQLVALTICVATTDGRAQFELSFSFHVPDNAQELRDWTPKRLAYAHEATANALRDAERCRRSTALAMPDALETPIASSEYAPPAPERRSSFWSGLTAIVLGWMIGDALFGDDCD